MKKFYIKNKSINLDNSTNKKFGGWITNDKLTCLIKKRSSVINRIELDINDYGENDFSYDKSTSVFSKKILDEDDDFFYFYFLVHDIYSYYNLGSFIRTIVRLMTNYEPTKIKFLIDISKENIIANMNEQIEKLILSSTTAVIFTNVYILLSEELYNYYRELPNIKNQCINIEKIDNLVKIINGRIPFVIKEENCNKFNLFYNFCTKSQYIFMEYINTYFPTDYAAIGHILPLYDDKFLKMKKTRFFVACIEKVPNLERIYGLFKRNNLTEILIICIKNAITEEEKNNNKKIINKCIDYNIKYSTINFIICKLKELKPQNIISVDLHPEAIVHKYNNIYKEFNDSFIFFGFESSGIPPEIIKMSTNFFQFEARSSINVIAATSILLSSIYK